MLSGLLGKKIGMTQIFTSEGTVIPVTVLQVGPCVVVQKKTVEKDGYNALQIGFEKVVKLKKVNKPMLGHFKKHNVEPMKYLKEVRVDNPDEFNEGQELTVDIFEEGEFVDVQGISKGKGFQGVMKRHGFAGGPSSHGSKFHRAPGSVGMCEFPGETPKGRKMPGRMGGEKVTVQNLQVVKVIKDKNLVLVKGAVPGHNNSLIFVKKAIKARKRA